MLEWGLDDEKYHDRSGYALLIYTCENGMLRERTHFSVVRLPEKTFETSAGKFGGTGRASRAGNAGIPIRGISKKGRR